MDSSILRRGNLTAGLSSRRYRIQCGGIARGELAASFGAYNLNWHDDLIVYSMLPYKENRTFMINYYDPGFGKPAEVGYSVTGSDVLVDRGGATIDCWVLEHGDENGTEKFLDLQEKPVRY